MGILMSRYILEIQQDPSLLKKCGECWYPDIDEYRKFIHKQEKNNENFAKLIEKYRLVKKEDNVIETVMSKELNNVSSFLNKDATMIESGYGTIYLPGGAVIPKLEYPSCYISNGVYHDTLNIINSLINYGSFIVGVCDNPNSFFYKENMERLKEISNYLHNKHISYHKYEHINHRDKCYILSYRSDKQ